MARKEKRLFFVPRGSSTMIFVIGSLIIGLLAGSILTSVLLRNRSLPGLGKVCGSYDEGYDAARKKIEDAGFVVNRTVNSLAGEVSAVNGDKVSFSAPLPSPLLSDDLKIRTAVATAETKIKVLRAKTAEEMQSDSVSAAPRLEELNDRSMVLRNKMADCQESGGSKACASLQDQISALNQEQSVLRDGQMSQFVVVGDKLSDIQPGARITVTASENVAEAKEFKAVSIEAILK